jgi:galactokinase
MVAAVTREFERLTGHAPVGVWSAPGRVNLIGEHTDYNGGLCLPIALPHRTYAAVSARGDHILRVRSLQRTDETVEIDLAEIGPDRPGGWAAYVAGVLWALERDGHAVSGLDVVIDSTVPVGAGLSSSAALECSVAAAVSDLAQLGLLESREGRARLARACVEAENIIAGAPTGGLDQSAALLCAERSALLLDCRSGETSQVPFDLAARDLALLVTDTRAPHALVDGQYAARRAACEEAARVLGVRTLREIGVDRLGEVNGSLPDDTVRARVRHVVTEIDRVERTVDALGRDDLAEVGRLFDASHASLRDDYEVSCPELDLATATARAHGALGARMTGGGFGGSCIAIVPADAVDAVSAAIEVAFAKQGYAPPVSFAVVAGGPAARDI